MPTLTEVLADVLEIRGVLAAAVVNVDGEILAGGASDTTLLDRITGAVTGALAAGEALSSLVAKSLSDPHAEDDWRDHDEDGPGPVEHDGEAPDGARDDPAAAGSGPASSGRGAASAGSGTASAGHGAVPANGKQLMVIYEDSGPIVLTP